MFSTKGNLCCVDSINITGERDVRLVGCQPWFIVITALYPAEGVPMDHVEVHLVPHQVPDVVVSILDHGGSLQTQTPRDHIHILHQKYNYYNRKQIYY